MTGQVYDQCEYEGVNYVILGAVGETLPTAASFNIEPADLCTGFHRGYIMYYAIVDNQLLLKKMVVTTLMEPPIINNISPEGTPPYHQYSYLDLNYPVGFTGFFTLGKDLIQELKTHMGYQASWTYTTVLKMTIESGIVTAIFDRSAEIATKREHEIELKKAKAKAARKAAKKK